MVLEVANMDGNAIISLLRGCLENESKLKQTIEAIAEKQYNSAMQSGAMLKQIARN